MTFDQRLELKLRQRLLPVPVLAQYMRLVRSRISDVHAEVDSALEANPFLTRAPGTACPGCGRHLRGRRCPSCAALGAAAPIETIRARTDWRAALVDLVCLELDAPRSLVEQVVHRLDDRGFLVDSPSALASQIGAPQRDVVRVIEQLRQVGPPGIAACSPIDCLRLQSTALVADGSAPAVLVEIVDRHLELVAAGELDAVAAITARPLSEVQRAVDILRHRTRPFVMLDTGPEAPAPPDMVIRRHGREPSRLVVDVADTSWFGLETVRPPDGCDAWARGFIHEAAVLTQQIEVRASLLRRIGDVLIAEQRDFLLAGATMHRPLRRTVVAAQLKVHPSTVGRAVRDKLLQCPDGRLIALSSCFGAATGPMEALRGALAELPEASDAALVTWLAGHDVHMARRTVSKYRGLLGMPARHPKPGSVRTA